MKRQARILLLGIFLLLTLPVSAAGEWVRIDPVNEEWDRVHGYWVMPPGDFCFDVQAQWTNAPRSVTLRVRTIWLYNDEDPLVDITEDIAIDEWAREPGLGRFWYIARAYGLPAGFYEIKCIAWFGGQRIIDAKYICPR